MREAKKVRITNEKKRAARNQACRNQALQERDDQLARNNKIMQEEDKEASYPGSSH